LNSDGHLKDWIISKLLENAAEKLVYVLRNLELPVPMAGLYKYSKLLLGPIGLWRVRAATLRI